MIRRAHDSHLPRAIAFNFLPDVKGVSTDRHRMARGQKVLKAIASCAR